MMYQVLGQTFGPEDKFRWVLVPIWMTAVAANEALINENESK